MPYNGEARIVCRLRGATRVTIGAEADVKESHPTFNANLISIRLFNVPPMPLGPINDNDRGQCLDKVKLFLTQELPPTYSVDETPGHEVQIAGHAWRDGRWYPTNPAYYAYAFQLFRDDGGTIGPIQDTCEFKDTAGVNNQALRMTWWIVVQPEEPT